MVPEFLGAIPTPTKEWFGLEVTQKERSTFLSGVNQRFPEHCEVVIGLLLVRPRIGTSTWSTARSCESRVQVPVGVTSRWTGQRDERVPLEGEVVLSHPFTRSDPQLFDPHLRFRL